MVSNWEKNPVHQTGYFKLENWENPVQIDRVMESKVVVFEERYFELIFVASQNIFNGSSNFELTQPFILKC